MDTKIDLQRFIGDPADPFGLPPEHVQFRSQFRRFVTTRLVPLAERAEKEQRFPLEAYALLREGGYLGVNYPEADGGSGGDLLMGCIFYEELTRAAAGVSAGVFAHQHLAVGSVLRLGSAEQRQQWGLPGLRGEAIGASRGRVGTGDGGAAAQAGEHQDAQNERSKVSARPHPSAPAHPSPRCQSVAGRASPIQILQAEAPACHGQGPPDAD